MKLIDFIFKLLFKFVPIDSVEYGKLRDEGQNWYDNINVDTANPALSKLKIVSEKWYTKVGLAVLFIIMVRQIQLFMNPNLNPDEDDED